MNSTRGIFISFEGSEGCGKTTQLARLVESLKNLKVKNDLVFLREPGGTLISEEIRSLLKCSKKGNGMSPETELLLFAASRAQLVREVIGPALEAGKVVFCDRFTDSTLVYQGIARGLDIEFIKALNQFVLNGVRKPDITFVFDLPLHTAKERMILRKTSDRLEAESDQFFEKVRNGYLELVEKEPDRIVVIDASKSVDQIQNDILKTLSEKFHGIFPDSCA